MTSWLQDRTLLYRLSDDRHPVNRDEIRVTMAEGSRDDQTCTQQATALLALLLAEGGWIPMDAAPRDGTPFLALLAEEQMFSRVHVATILPNIATVGGSFEFDMPKMIGWRPILGVPS